MTAWTVMLRGIRYRAGRSLVVFVLAALATTAAVLAPGYSRAAQQSVLTDALRGASADATGLVVGARGSASAVPAAFRGTDELRLSMTQALTRQPVVAGRLDSPVAAVDTDGTLVVGTDASAAKFAFRDGVCAHLRITGSCPAASGEVALSERTAEAHKLRVGDLVAMVLGSPTAGKQHTYRISGLYTPGDTAEAYWGRTVYFGQSGSGAADTPRVDAVFTTNEDDPRAEHTGVVSTRLEYPLRTDDVRLDDVAPLRDGVRGLRTALDADDLDLTTALPSVLDDVAADGTAIGRTAPVIAVPLLVLCWFVLFLLVASVVEERAPEIALAKLRGYPAPRAARFALGEALLLIALAAPVGLLAGLVLVEVAARAVLVAGHVELRWPVFAAAGLALLGAVAAALLAGRRTLGRDVLGLLRRVPARTRWRAGVAEGVVVALAGAALLAAIDDRSSPLALLAPPLLAVVAGIATARLLGLGARLRLPLARRRGSLVPLLSAAHLSRRPGGQRVVVVVTVAVALLSFAATAWDVAAQARRERAQDTLGAARVYSVVAAHPAALADAVAAADPDGHAMAVVRTSQRYAGESVELLGVQAARLPAVAMWRGYDDAALRRLAGALHPAAAAPLTLRSDLDVAVAGDVLPPKVPLRLAATVVAPGEPPHTVGLGTLVKGLHSYHTPLPGCTGGCRLVGLTVGRQSGGAEPYTAGFTVAGIGSGGTVLKAGLDTPKRWRVVAPPGGPEQAKVTLAPVPAGLAVGISSTDAGDATVQYVDAPEALPAVVAGGAPADDGHAAAFQFPGFAEQPQAFTVAAHADALPRAGRRGLLFDLDYAVRDAERSSGLADNDSLRYEVWAAPDAPADLTGRLAGAGVQVLHADTLDGTVAQLGRRAPALGLWLYLLAGAAALVLAVGVVLLTAHVGLRARLYELAALRVAGVRTGVLRRAVLREYRLLLGAPLLVGCLAGIAGAVVMLPGVPLVTVGTPAGALDFRPVAGALPVALGATLVGFGLAVVLVLRMLGRATPERLRDGVS